LRSLSLRGIPDHVYEGLKRVAAANHRSMQEQVRLWIDREVDLAQPGLLDRAAGWRQRLTGRDFGSVVAALRADRER